MTGETAAGQGPTSSADRRMAQDRYRAPRRPHRMVHALRTRWLREIREMRCRLASGCQRTSAGSSARPVKGSFAVADAMAQATLDRPALPGGFRQLSDEASPRLSWQPGDRTWHRPASPAHSPGQTNPHARHTRASRSRTLIRSQRPRLPSPRRRRARRHHRRTRRLDRLQGPQPVGAHSPGACPRNGANSHTASALSGTAGDERLNCPDRKTLVPRPNDSGTPPGPRRHAVRDARPAGRVITCQLGGCHG